jgi:hypothetical protein
VGIDLGTTNSAVCFVDTLDSDWSVQTLPIQQLVGPGEVQAKDTLPSFHYQPAQNEFSDQDLSLPWQSDHPQDGGSTDIVGAFARDHGAQVPGRLSVSAKSWLCHSGVDRTARILPWQGSDDVERQSPVEISSHYLSHLRACWQHTFPDHPLQDQTVVLTIPASFDEVARNLTIRAAQSAGLPRVLLIEEPQAAFYAWIDRHRDNWESIVSPGQKILVCDVGGGTTDFTLIQVKSDSDGKVVFHRVAVGNHLILGGDNLDLALAHFVEQQFQAAGHTQLTAKQWSVLVRVARQVKETLLSSDAPDTYTVTLPGTGSKLIGGSIQTTVAKEDVVRLLIDGFLPVTKFSDKPTAAQSGFREFGLPFAADSAITRYLAHFLSSHADDSDTNANATTAARPDILLFNGGLFESAVLQQRFVECLHHWFDSCNEANSHNEGHWSLQVLDCGRLDLAVAHGAACYGMVSRGSGTRIAAGLPRSYYIGVSVNDTNQNENVQAVCLVPAGIEPNTTIPAPDHTFALELGKPVEFPVYYSGTRLTDPVGKVIDVDPQQLTALPPIRTVIREKRGADAETFPIRLNARLSEIDTLELWCASVSDDQRWKLQFDVRSTTRTDLSAHQTGQAEAEGIVDAETLDTCRSILSQVFGPDATGKASGLARRIGREISLSRSDWPTSLLREMWSTLIELDNGRRKSPTHESNWINLLGFCLRPGWGYAMDDWRVETTWNLLNGHLFHNTPENRAQIRILWRRIAGGLTSGQQTSIASALLSSIRQTVSQMNSGRGKGGPVSLNDKDASEIWRMLGSFEQLPLSVRHEIGTVILQFAVRPKMAPVLDAMIWALGRIGSRVPLNGSSVVTIEPATVEHWLSQLMTDRFGEVPSLPLCIMQLARRTDNRFVDVSESVRQEAVRFLKEQQAADDLIRLIEQGGETDRETQSAMFGEALPLGLRMSG